MSNQSNSLSPIAAIFRGMGRNLMLRGILELVIGILLLINPLKTVVWLTIVIGVLLILDGVVLFFSYLRTKASGRHWMLINAAALIVFGAVIVCSPLLMDELWIIVLGVWHIVSAVNELFGGGWRRKMGIVSSALSLVVGVIFVALPFLALNAMITITGIVLIASGFLSIVTGYDLRAASKKA